MAVILLARVQLTAGPRGYVGAVGVFLGLQTEGGILGIGDALLSDDLTVLEVAAVELDAGFIGINLQLYALDSDFIELKQSFYLKQSLYLNTIPYYYIRNYVNLCAEPLS